MPASALFTTLLAETHLAEVSLQYREKVVEQSGWSLAWLLVPLLLAIVAGLIYLFSDRAPTIQKTPQGMLYELCKAHRIKGGARRLLAQIAEEAELEHPATLFLGPTQLEDAVQRASKHMRFDRRQKAHLEMLRRRLFAS